MNTLLLVAAVGLGFVEDTECGDGLFTRGDSNGDGYIDTTDSSNIMLHLTQGWQPCELESLDVNDDGYIDTTDPIVLNYHLFYSSPPTLPPPWFADELGVDTTPDALANETSPPIWFASIIPKVNFPGQQVKWEGRLLLESKVDILGYWDDNDTVATDCDCDSEPGWINVYATNDDPASELCDHDESLYFTTITVEPEDPPLPAGWLPAAGPISRLYVSYEMDPTPSLGLLCEETCDAGNGLWFDTNTDTVIHCKDKDGPTTFTDSPAAEARADQKGVYLKYQPIPNVCEFHPGDLVENLYPHGQTHKWTSALHTGTPPQNLQNTWWQLTKVVLPQIRLWFTRFPGEDTQDDVVTTERIDVCIRATYAYEWRIPTIEF